MVSIMLITSVSCDTAPEPPLPPIVQDCSFNTTVTVVDSLDGFPPACQNGTGGIYTTWYEGYEITDISFNPNDPNEMAVAMEIYQDGVIPQISSTSGGSAIVRVDLCTGTEQVIFAKEEGGRLNCLDWGSNDTIVFVRADPPHSVFTIRPDGSGLTGTLVPFPYGDAENLKLSKDGTSFLIYEPYRVSKFTINGQLIMEDIGLLAHDFDYLPDGSLGYFNATQDVIGTFDLETGVSVILFDVPYLSNRFDIAYSAKHNGLLWAVDTVVGLTNIETGQTTFLKQIPTKVGWYWYTACSSNGYLAYVARVRSPSLSVPCASMVRNEIRFINADGTNERTLVLDFQ